MICMADAALQYDWGSRSTDICRYGWRRLGITLVLWTREGQAVTGMVQVATVIRASADVGGIKNWVCRISE